MKTIYTLLVFLCIIINTKAQNENKIISKYDFIPGEKIIFFDDFSTDNVGDFPAHWNTNSSGEIVTIEKFPGKWLQITGGGYFLPVVNESLTENYTVEFDMVPYHTESTEYLNNMNFMLISGTLNDPNEGGAIPGKAGTSVTPNYDQVDWTNWAESVGGYRDNGQSPYGFKIGEKYHVCFWVQKQRIRMYANEKKILDLPRGLIEGYVYNIFRIQTTSEIKSIIANFRIAVGLPDLRNKLISEGKYISYGILFDVNSDKLKPESSSTIKEIAQVLKENQSVKIKIVGHTDNDGDESKNLDLSKRRAESVKNELNKVFGIEINRIETDGKGESAPIAPNDNSINKAKNRRVEFVKL